MPIPRVQRTAIYDSFPMGPEVQMRAPHLLSGDVAVATYFAQTEFLKAPLALVTHKSGQRNRVKQHFNV